MSLLGGPGGAEHFKRPIILSRGCLKNSLYGKSLKEYFEIASIFPFQKRNIPKERSAPLERDGDLCNYFTNVKLLWSYRYINVSGFEKVSNVDYRTFRQAFEIRYHSVGM